MTNQSAPTGQLSRSKKLVFSLLVTVAFFVLLEVVLALARVDPVIATSDPFVGFSKVSPLFVEDQQDDGQAMMTTAVGKEVWFNPQSFPRSKPAGTKRIFCLGGSTTFGRPFDDSTSYCGWLRQLLPLTDKESKWEVINAGGVSYASYRVAAVMEELVQYDPDLFIVFTAHNEFLERRTYAAMFEQPEVSRTLSSLLHRSRTWRVVSDFVGRDDVEQVDSREILPTEVDEILNHSAGPTGYHRNREWQGKVAAHYRVNLERMISLSRDSGAEILFISPAVNLRDCAPFKSEHRDGLSLASSQRFQELSKRLRSRDGSGSLGDRDFAQWNELLSIDPEYADTQFRFARDLFAAGMYAEAERAFRLAVDQDICPLRATSRIRSILKDVASEEGVSLVDFDDRLSAKSKIDHGHSCVGREYFLDHVHPTIETHGLIADWIIEAMIGNQWLSGPAPSASDRGLVARQISEGIDGNRQARAFRNLAKVLHWAGKFSEALPLARDAIRLDPADLESRLVLADCFEQTGRREDALFEYETLFSIGDYPRAQASYGDLLWRMGRAREAKPYLLQGLLADTAGQRARAFFALGGVHLELGEPREALEALQEANRLYPNDPTTIWMIADAQNRLGRWQEACQLLHQLATENPRHFKVHFTLASVLLEHGQKEEAKEHARVAYQLRPQDQGVKELMAALGDTSLLNAEPISER